jgi:hypothetical protein
MFDDLHNPIFVGGVILAAITITVILWQVVKSIIRSFFWQPKKTTKSDHRQFHFFTGRR